MEKVGGEERFFTPAVMTLCVMFAAGLLLFSAVQSQGAPLGSWMNRIFGQAAWAESDPGSFYIDSAHQLRWGGRQLFIGHPGIVLVLLLAGVQHAYYAIAGDGGLSFTAFTARQLPAVFVLSKIMMTLLHLISIFCLFLLSRKILRNDRAAFFAALGYATSLPVLYFLSRISVEPIVVICMLVAFLAIWRYQEHAIEGRGGPALGFVGVSAVAAISGFVTKLNLMGPLPFMLFVYILGSGSRWTGSERPIATRIRVQALATFALGGGALTLFYSQFLDWSEFVGFWVWVAQFDPTVAWTPSALLPGLRPERIFLTSELAVIAIGVVGWVTFLRDHPDERARVLWVTAYGGWGLLVWLFRVAKLGNLLPFHYFFVTEAILAVFFGYAVDRALRRFPVVSTHWRAAVVGLVCITALHAASVATVIDSRRDDTALYEPLRSVHALISGLGPHERLGCIGCRRSAWPELSTKIFDLHTMGFQMPGEVPEPSQTSRLRLEYESLFVPIPRARVRADQSTYRIPPLGLRVVVLRDPQGRMRGFASPPSRD